MRHGSPRQTSRASGDDPRPAQGEGVGQSDSAASNQARPPTGNPENGGGPRARTYVRRVLVAMLVGLALYAVVYAYVESLVYQYGDQNSFFEVVAHDGSEAMVVLGASHALPLKYGDMNEEMERAFGTSVVNLAITGGGVVPNRLLWDFYQNEHGAGAAGLVVYVIDSFAFYSSEWNEDRLEDARLWERAPYDADLVGSLWASTWRDGLDPTIILKYLSGFTKLNDPTDWYAPDVWPAEEDFEDSYSPSEVQDQQRIDYLYPEQIDWDTAERYFGMFEELVSELERNGVPMVVVKTPVREAFRSKIPQEEAFDERLGEILEDHDVPLHDFSAAGFEDELFFDPDHLNGQGARRFLQEYLRPALGEHVEAGEEPNE